MDFISSSTILSGRLERSRGETIVAQASDDEERITDNDRRRMAAFDDARLLEECRSGHFVAFDELVNRYRDKVLRLVASVLGFRHDVEDIAQDIFIKVYLSLDRFRGDASFSTYLYTVTVNRCRDELRRSKLRKFFSFDDWFGTEGRGYATGENGHQLECDERQRVVRQAMKRLPTATQMLLYLREIEELSYKELADIFEVEIGTIKSRLARGRDRLRVELLPYLKEGILPGETSSNE
jgi:RNA polymerase sigma-70 factor (ECF subfamily)